jgi:hypothetical protein
MKLYGADDRPLPVQRAFVVQLHATADVAQARLVGRIEHVVSGQALHFHTLEELLTFMARVLATLEAGRPEASEHAPLPPCDPEP